MTNLDFLDKPNSQKPANGNLGTKLLIVIVLLAIALANGIYQDARIDAQQNTKTEDYEDSMESASAGNMVSSPYIIGDWGEKFIRSNGYTYPFEFTLPLQQCGGFTLDYYITDVSEGNLEGNFRFEIYVRTTAGNWKSVELFSMDGYEKSVPVRFDRKMDIEAVAVVCQKNADVTFSYGFGVRDIIY